MNPAPAASPASRESRAAASRRPRILYVANSTRGHITPRVRGTLYKEFFERDGWDIAFADAARQRDAEILAAARDCDVVCLLKVDSLRLVRGLRRSRALLVFDLTDRLWNRPSRLAGWHDLEAILRRVDAVFCENEAVREYARRCNGRVVVLPTCAQVESFDAVRATASRREPGGVRIGWVGSRTTVNALERIRGPLRAVCARHPEAELRIVGAAPQDVARILNGLPYTVLAEYDEARMIREMLDLDIGLFPAPFDADDYRARGPLKALLYMAAGVPPVCERDGDCALLVRDGETGMLAGSITEWEEKLEALVASAGLRRSMGEAALARVRRGHTLRQSFGATREALATLLEALEAGRIERRPPRLRHRIQDTLRGAAFRVAGWLAAVRRLA